MKIASIVLGLLFFPFALPYNVADTGPHNYRGDSHLSNYYVAYPKQYNNERYVHKLGSEIEYKNGYDSGNYKQKKEINYGDSMYYPNQGESYKGESNNYRNIEEYNHKKGHKSDYMPTMISDENERRKKWRDLICEKFSYN